MRRPFTQQNVLHISINICNIIIIIILIARRSSSTQSRRTHDVAHTFHIHSWANLFTPLCVCVVFRVIITTNRLKNKTRSRTKVRTLTHAHMRTRGRRRVCVVYRSDSNNICIFQHYCERWGFQWEGMAGGVMLFFSSARDFGVHVFTGIFDSCKWREPLPPLPHGYNNICMRVLLPPIWM